MKAEEFERKFDEAQEDLFEHLELPTARRVNLESKRINVDFPSWVVEGLGSGSHTDWSDPLVDHQDVVGGAFTAGSLSSIKFLLIETKLNSISGWKTLAHFGEGGTTLMVSEGFD